MGISSCTQHSAIEICYGDVYALDGFGLLKTVGTCNKHVYYCRMTGKWYHVDNSIATRTQDAKGRPCYVGCLRAVYQHIGVYDIPEIEEVV